MIVHGRVLAHDKKRIDIIAALIQFPGIYLRLNLDR